MPCPYLARTPKSPMQTLYVLVMQNRLYIHFLPFETDAKGTNLHKTMVVVFSFHTGIWEKVCNESVPACVFVFLLFFVVVFFSGDQLARTSSTLHGRMSPQWLSELRRLWSSVP